MGAHHGHDMGHTVAGWAGTLTAVTGTTVTGLGVITGAGPVLWLGLALTALAAPATWALHLAGWGKPSGPDRSSSTTGAAATPPPAPATPTASAAASPAATRPAPRGAPLRPSPPPSTPCRRAQTRCGNVDPHAARDSPVGTRQRTDASMNSSRRLRVRSSSSALMS